MSLGVIAREANPERTKSIFIMLQLLLGALLTMVLTSMLSVQGPGIVRLSLIGPSLLAMLALFLFQSGEIAAFTSAIEIGLKHGPALEFTGSAVAASVSLQLVPAPFVYLIANIGFGVFFGLSFSYLMGVALQANSWMLAVSPARMLHGRNRTGRVFW